MSIATYTTDDGYTLEVFSSLYVDWGLRISKEGEEEDVFYHACFLSNESHGRKPNEEAGYDDWDEAEKAALDGAGDAFVEWDEDDWLEWLKEEADELLEACVPECN